MKAEDWMKKEYGLDHFDNIFELKDRVSMLGIMDEFAKSQSISKDHEIKEARLPYPVEERDKSNDDIFCPVCGYYCLGKGGVGCIDKPTLCGITPPKQ